MADISLFSFPPWRLGIGERIGAALDNLRHARPELSADFVEHRDTTAIFDYMVKQRCDRHIFISAKLHHERHNPHQVRDVRDLQSVTCFAGMLISGKKKCPPETWPQLHD